MCDQTSPEVKLGSELQLVIVELPKLAASPVPTGTAAAPAGLAVAQRLSPALQAWITYFQHWNEEGIMNQIDYAPVQQAMAELHALSADQETRAMAERAGTGPDC